MGGIISRWNTSKTQLPSTEDVKEEDPVLTRTLGFAWVTLATNDSYSLGALVLAHSLRNVKTVHKLAVLITPAVSPSMREQLSTVFDLVKVVDVLDSKDEAHLALMKRPELGVTFTKIHCWKLTDFEKCVFLDADTLVIKNCDELFDREELSAAPDVGWPDCFNTGVFVYKPSVDTFNNLIKFSIEQGSFDGGDQGLLNQYFGDWATLDIKKHLPFVYNLTSVAVYSYIPAFKQYGSDVRIVHFIGSGKPWLQQLDPSTRTVNPTPGAEHLAPLLQKWWDIFCEKVHPSMSTNLECASGMSNDEIEACANNVPLESEPAESIQPFTPYIDKDDSRQINLPYHPFDVKSSSGELLNVTYLEQRERDMLLEQQNREREQREREKDFLREEGPREEEKEEGKELYDRGESDYQRVQDKPKQEVIATDWGTETKFEVEPDVPRKEEEAPQVEKSPFSYDTFYPDENCVQNYLEKNYVTYQTRADDKNPPIEVTQEKNPPLPRFLTMAEDDKRQSLNVRLEEPPPPPAPVQNDCTSTDPSSAESRADEKNLELHPRENVNASDTVSELQEAKPLSNSKPNSSSAKQVEEVSFWKTHPNSNADQNKKYSMPKLKPLLPKQNVSYVAVDGARPKITQYTEFHMNCNYEDALPSDKLGFIERHILEEVKNNDMDNETKLHALSYIFPQRSNNKENSLKFVPPSFDETTDYDLSLCMRQKGNQPLTNVTNKNNSRVNTCFLPVLKPLRPSKGDQISKKLSSHGPKSKDRGTKPKIESRKARDKSKAEIKPNVLSNNVEDVLKRLMDFSKDYQKYFRGFTSKQKADIAAAPNTVKNGYVASTESPRLQYNKEFEENADAPIHFGVSSLLNNGSTQNTSPTEQYNGGFPRDFARTEPVLTSPVSNPWKSMEQVAAPIKINLTSSNKPLELTAGNGCPVERLESKEENLQRQRLTRETKLEGENEENESTTGNCSNEGLATYAAVVKRGERTVESAPTGRNRPARKTKKTSRGTFAKKDKIKKNNRGSCVEPSVAIPPPNPRPRPPPPPPRAASPAKEPKPKPSNIFTLLPEDSSDKKTGKARSISRRPGKTFSRSVRKMNPGTRSEEPSTESDDSTSENSGIAGAIAKLSLQPGGLPGTESEAASSAQEDYIRRQNWEMGTMDYMGRDSFDNIWSKICETLDGKVIQDRGSDGESINKSSAPSKEIKSADLAPENPEEKQPIDVAPEKMTVEKVESGEVAPQGEQKVPGTGLESSEVKSDLSSKACQALEVFGKLFVSGPVAIKSEVSEDEKSKQPEAEETASSERKKSIGSDEELKKKKGVLTKILELVGVEPSAAPKSVFYDTEKSEPDSKANVGQSVFYDVEDDKEPPAGLAVAEEASEQPKKRSPSPSLQLKTTPGTEIVSPTPPSTPQTGQIISQDQKFLVAVDTIMETPPVTDACDKDIVKSQVESIIESAVHCAEEQLKRVSDEVSAKAEELPNLLPKASEALEAFGKLFVSGPVTIKSEVAEEAPKSVETLADNESRAEETETISKVPTEVVETRQDNISKTTDQSSELPPAPVQPESLEKSGETELKDLPKSAGSEAALKSTETESLAKSIEAQPETIPKSVEAESGSIAKSGGTEPEISTKSIDSLPTSTPPEVVPKSTETESLAKSVETQPETIPKSVEAESGSIAKSGGTEPEISTKSTDSLPTSTTPEVPKPGEFLPKPGETGPQVPTESVESDASSKVAETTPEVSEKPAEISSKPAEVTSEMSQGPRVEDSSTKTDAKSPEICPKSTEILPEECVKSEDKDSLKSSEVTSKHAETAPEEPGKSEGKTGKCELVESRASEALEAFGKMFTSGPVVLKSEIPEEKPSSPPEELSGAASAEPSQVFVSGPVTLKSETDPVHRAIQDEPIYCNIEELEEIKVTSEEDRKKDKPQSSKLTEQILKAIPPQERKPFTDSASSEVSQFLASIEPQNVSILLDKPLTDEMVTAEEDDSSAIPPVPPRRNRSKGRDAPLPPPKKKGKNGKC